MPFPQIAPGFDQPLWMLRACHARVLRQCDTLIQVAQYLGDKGATAEVREAAHQVHRYFSTAGKQHHEDEEQDLFPVLLSLRPELADRIYELRFEHREMEHLWERLVPTLADIGSLGDIPAFTYSTIEFRAVYFSHIERENTEILPAAQEAMSPVQLSELGRRMAHRRGISL
ncbi:MAG: hemerythrin domain-containing protein [Acidiferrobacterales bacterium]